MKVYIEGLVIIIIFFTFFIWFMWNKLSERRLLKKYKPENDKGRKGNEFRGSETTELGARESNISINGYEQLERRELLQETESNNDGETNKSSRKLRFTRRKR